MFKQLPVQEDLILLEGDRLVALQHVLLSMLRDFDSACAEAGVDYMLGGGSCLGAVRHQGFIPWDDDLDIIMTRSDFKRLKARFDELLGEAYWLHVPGETPGYDLAFARLRKKGTVVRCRDDLDGSDECGVYIDVFFIENAPGLAPARALHGLVSMAYGFVYSCARFAVHADDYLRLAGSDERAAGTFRRKARIGRLFSFRLPEAWAAAWDRWNGRCRDERSAFVSIPVGRRHYFGELYRRDDLLPASRGAFEGMSAPLPARPGPYLEALYGPGYMTPPPEAERERHVVLELDLGDALEGEGNFESRD